MKNCTRREFIQNTSLGILGIGTTRSLKDSKDVYAGQFPKAQIAIDSAEKKKMVVISDIHFGVDNCLLNKENKENIEKLIQKIKKQEPEELILLGDIFDFSLCSVHVSCNNAKVFFDELKKHSDGLEVTYIPGNHDHHIWTYIMESEYLIKPLAEGRDPEDMNSYMEKCVNTGLFKMPFLDHFYPGLKVTYPHIIRTCGENRYYFTHGHLQDNIFTPGSDMVPPKNLAELEAFNSWWIEGGWFYMGQAGRLGEKINKDIYKGRSWSDFIIVFSRAFGSLLNALWELARHPKKVGFREKDTIKPMPYEYEYGEGRIVEPAAVTPEHIQDYIDLLVPPLPLSFTFVYGHTHQKRKEIIKERRTINTGAWLGKDEENNGFWVVQEEEPKWIPFWE